MAATPIRTVRVPDDLWDRVQEKAKRENIEVSAVIRRALFIYVRDDRLPPRTL